MKERLIAFCVAAAAVMLCSHARAAEKTMPINWRMVLFIARKQNDFVHVTKLDRG
jgi:hypothetical protein